MFEELLGKRPEHILQDAQDNPDSYDQETLLLLHELMNGKVQFEDLNDEQQSRLDHATLEFHQATPASRRQPAHASPHTRGGMFPEPPRADKPVEGPVVDSFWWT